MATYKRTSEAELKKHLDSVTIPVTNTRINLFKKSLEAITVEGMNMEFGVMSGGTINSISNIIPNKTVYGFDSWLGLPDDFTARYPAGVFVQEIPKTFNPNVELVVGMIETTLPRFLERHPEKIAFVHMDVDIYSSTKYVLDTLAPRIQVGTVIQFDEIFEAEEGWWYLGEFNAWNDFVKEHNVEYEYVGWMKSCHCSFKIMSIN